MVKTDRFAGQYVVVNDVIVQFNHLGESLGIAGWADPTRKDPLPSDLRPEDVASLVGGAHFTEAEGAATAGTLVPVVQGTVQAPVSPVSAVTPVVMAPAPVMEAGAPVPPGAQPMGAAAAAAPEAPAAEEAAEEAAAEGGEEHDGTVPPQDDVDLTKAQIIKRLSEAGVQVPARVTRVELLALAAEKEVNLKG